MNGNGPNPGQSFNFLSGAGGQAYQRDQQRQNYQSKIDELVRQLQFGQVQGANPMQMAGLQQQVGQANRGMQDWQQQQYGQQMGQWNQPGSRNVGGGGMNPSMAQQNPFLQMLLMGQLGMGGGRGPVGG